MFGSSIHCWTVPLPNVVSPTIVARFAILERARDDLARRRAAPVDEDDELDAAAGREACPTRRRSPPASRRPSSSQKIGPESMNSLAIRRAAVT